MVRARRPDAFSRDGGDTASLDAQGENARLSGTLSFTTVAGLLPMGGALIREGRAGVIDLAQVDASDSAGLALLIEWLSIARSAGRKLRYENVPGPLLQLARLSDVERLLQQGV